MKSYEGQKFYAQYSSTVALRSSMPVNFIIGESSQIWMSMDVRLIGNYVPTVQLKGRIAGILDLKIEEKRQVWVYRTASNSRFDKEGNELVLPNGKHSFFEKVCSS